MDREYRALVLEPVKNGESEYCVKGLAATFKPYCLYVVDNIEYKERIEPNAFDGCDMSDVVFRIDHIGPVYARSSAGTLRVNATDEGLVFEADLGKTASARGIYEDVAAGNYPKASFAFTVECDHYEPETHTRVIDAFRKIYDVSPVTFPANDSTMVGCRDYFSAQEEMIRKAEEQRKALLLRLRLM